jgi:hypothetical protein
MDVRNDIPAMGALVELHGLSSFLIVFCVSYYIDVYPLVLKNESLTD